MEIKNLKKIDIEYYEDENIYVEYVDFENVFYFKNKKTKYTYSHCEFEKIAKTLKKLGYEASFNKYNND